jgi:IS4 transposase
VNNPKTPVAISLGFIPRMSERELAILEKSRNIPGQVRTAARNLLAKKKLGKG